ncbi:MAG: HEPN domain-containing protein [Nanoarchaeota archaeon]|nr:HEPN domain-containing protein [Nanoarchaeota archaeon]MBU4242338.1 HEPN domain-containing protein [Nanoarchaeota archaeon]MBU4352579.1 HEPN domain-containing protein [Nanoarchaeota archaeon]MBU4456872.1 HEPN domain-containing protein [Nanoarchaeota archaeon]MCG2719566.1 HEPN domain-containing protein [Nanoarchaeota archaeon]
MKSLHEKFKWCLRQKKGIKLVDPSEALYLDYLDKAKKSIISAEANLKEGVFEWVIVAAYYARYFAFYALLQKAGINCEIHDCTINAVGLIFGNIIPDKLLREIKHSKDRREDSQYFIQKSIPKDYVIQDLKNARVFLTEIRSIIEDIGEDEVALIRNNLKKL